MVDIDIEGSASGAGAGAPLRKGLDEEKSAGMLERLARFTSASDVAP